MAEARCERPSLPPASNKKLVFGGKTINTYSQTIGCRFKILQFIYSACEWKANLNTVAF